MIREIGANIGDGDDRMDAPLFWGELQLNGSTGDHLDDREGTEPFVVQLFGGSVSGIIGSIQPDLIPVTTHAQPLCTDVPQPHTDLSHGAQTFSKVGTGCTATSHMTSLLVYSPFSSWISPNLVTSLLRDPVTEGPACRLSPSPLRIDSRT